MRVRVLFFGQIKDIMGKAEEEVEVPEGACLGDIFARFARSHPQLGAMRNAIVLARNQAFVGPEETLRDGDEVALLPPVSGGIAN